MSLTKSLISFHCFPKVIKKLMICYTNVHFEGVTSILSLSAQSWIDPMESKELKLCCLLNSKGEHYPGHLLERVMGGGWEVGVRHFLGPIFRSSCPL